MDDHELARLFAANRPPAKAQRLFADRDSEREAFDDALQHYLGDVERLRAGEWDAQDLDRARTNVLVFYGVGGIGKSTLIERLAERLDPKAARPSQWPPAPQTPYRLFTAMVDLQGPSPPSLDSILLAIRAALVPASGRFTAFDLLLTAYWAQNHPTEGLGDFLRRRTFGRRFSEAVGLPNHIEAAVGDVAAQLAGASAVGTSVTASIRAVLRAVRDRQLTNSAVSECRLLEELLSAPATVETLSFAPYVLAWDLARVQHRNRCGLVVFIDTFEDADDVLALHLQRLIWFLPNALFVVAGRNRLDWGDSPTSGPGFRSGPQAWPALAKQTLGISAQHLLGFLDDDEIVSYLQASIPETLSDQELAQVVRSGSGLPLHLDLVVQRWAQVRARHPPTVEDIALPFPELARRTFRDLSPDERAALRACCLFDAFDVRLVQITAGLAVSGPVRTLFQKPLIVERGTYSFPYLLHGVLREALLKAARAGDDEWTESDWRAAAGRALGELKDRCQEADDLRLPALQAFKLARSFGIGEPWLVDVAHELTSRSSWSSAWRADPVPGVPTSRAGERSWVDPLAEGLTVVMGRQVRPRGDVFDDLSRVLDSGSQFGPELDVVRYFYAEVARDVGRSDDSRAALEGIIQRDGAMRTRATHGLLHLLKREGRFREFADLLDAHGDVLRAAYRLQGDLLWTQARFDEAASSYRSGVHVAMGRNDLGEASLCRSFEAFALAFVKPGHAMNALEEATRAVERAFTSFAHVLLMVASSIKEAGTDASLPDATRGREAAARAGHSSLVAYSYVAEAFDAAVRDDLQVVQRVLGEFRGQFQGGRAFSYLEQVLSRWARQEASTPSCDWTDDHCLDRWDALVAARRRMIGG